MTRAKGPFQAGTTYLASVTGPDPEGPLGPAAPDPVDQLSAPVHFTELARMLKGRCSKEGEAPPDPRLTKRLELVRAHSATATTVSHLLAI